MTENKKGAVFLATIHQITSRKDGGGRITLEFGADALDDVQWAQKVAALRQGLFQVALVPIGINQSLGDDFQPDPETGEIEI